METPDFDAEEVVAENLKDNQIDDLQRQVNDLTAQKESLTKQMNDITNMLRFTLGIAIQARPELRQLQAMVNNLYKVD